jgi:hypothetical protein
LILVPLIGWGQYEYFSVSNSYNPDFHCASSNVIVLDDSTYLTFESLESIYLEGFRVYNWDGTLLSDLATPIEPYIGYDVNYAEAIINTSDGNYLWVNQASDGINTAGVFALFDETTLEPIWSLGVEASDSAFNLMMFPLELQDGRLIGIGNSSVDGDDEDWVADYSYLHLVVLSENGTFESQHFYPMDNYLFYPSNVFQLPNGEILVGGAAYNSESSAPIMCTISQDFEELSWMSSWGEDYTIGSYPRLVQVSDYEFVVAYKGEITGSPNTYCPWLMGYDVENHEVLWEIEYDHDPWAFLLHKMIKTSDGGYAILGLGRESVGPTHDYAWILKTDSLGNEEWYQKYNFEPTESLNYPRSDMLYDIENTLDGGFIAVGYEIGFVGDFRQKTWLLKLDACGDVEWQGCEPVQSAIELYAHEVNIWPNPASNLFSISTPSPFEAVQILSMDGSLIQELKFSSARNSETISVGGLAAGLYIVQCSGATWVARTRLVVE